MCISSAGDYASPRRHQAARKLNVPYPSSIIANSDQHHAVLGGDHDNWVFRLIRCIQVQPTDPATVVNLGVPEGRTELRQHVECSRSIAQHTRLVHRWQ